MPYKIKKNVFLIKKYKFHLIVKIFDIMIMNNFLCYWYCLIDLALLDAHRFCLVDLALLDAHRFCYLPYKVLI